MARPWRRPAFNDSPEAVTQGDGSPPQAPGARGLGARDAEADFGAEALSLGIQQPHANSPPRSLPPLSDPAAVHGSSPAAYGAGGDAACAAGAAGHTDGREGDSNGNVASPSSPRALSRAAALPSAGLHSAPHELAAAGTRQERRAAVVESPGADGVEIGGTATGDVGRRAGDGGAAASPAALEALPVRRRASCGAFGQRVQSMAVGATPPAMAVVRARPHSGARSTPIGTSAATLATRQRHAPPAAHMASGMLRSPEQRGARGSARRRQPQVSQDSNAGVSLDRSAMHPPLARLGAALEPQPAALLARVTRLDLSHNQLTSLEGLSAVPNLRELDVRSNALGAMEAVAASLARCASLRVLRIRGGAPGWARHPKAYTADLCALLPALESVDGEHNPAPLNPDAWCAARFLHRAWQVSPNEVAHLDLNGRAISGEDFMCVVCALQFLPVLSVRLWDNPGARIPAYRFHVIDAVRTAQVIDGRAVTADERANARREQRAIRANATRFHEEVAAKREVIMAHGGLRPTPPSPARRMLSIARLASGVGTLLRRMTSSRHFGTRNRTQQLIDDAAVAGTSRDVGGGSRAIASAEGRSTARVLDYGEGCATPPPIVAAAGEPADMVSEDSPQSSVTASPASMMRRRVRHRRERSGGGSWDNSRWEVAARSNGPILAQLRSPEIKEAPESPPLPPRRQRSRSPLQPRGMGDAFFDKYSIPVDAVSVDVRSANEPSPLFTPLDSARSRTPRSGSRGVGGLASALRDWSNRTLASLTGSQRRFTFRPLQARGAAADDNSDDSVSGAAAMPRPRFYHAASERLQSRFHQAADTTLWGVAQSAQQPGLMRALWEKVHPATISGTVGAKWQQMWHFLQVYGLLFSMGLTWPQLWEDLNVNTIIFRLVLVILPALNFDNLFTDGALPRWAQDTIFMLVMLLPVLILVPLWRIAGRQGLFSDGVIDRVLAATNMTPQQLIRFVVLVAWEMLYVTLTRTAFQCYQPIMGTINGTPMLVVAQFKTTPWPSAANPWNFFQHWPMIPAAFGIFGYTLGVPVWFARNVLFGQREAIKNYDLDVLDTQVEGNLRLIKAASATEEVAATITETRDLRRASRLLYARAVREYKSPQSYLFQVYNRNAVLYKLWIMVYKLVLLLFITFLTVEVVPAGAVVFGQALAVLLTCAIVLCMALVKRPFQARSEQMIECALLGASLCTGVVGFVLASIQQFDGGYTPESGTASGTGGGDGVASAFLIGANGVALAFALGAALVTPLIGCFTHRAAAKALERDVEAAAEYGLSKQSHNGGHGGSGSSSAGRQGNRAVTPSAVVASQDCQEREGGGDPAACAPAGTTASVVSPRADDTAADEAVCAAAHDADTASRARTNALVHSWFDSQSAVTVVGSVPDPGEDGDCSSEASASHTTRSASVVDSDTTSGKSSVRSSAVRPTEARGVSASVRFAKRVEMIGTPPMAESDGPAEDPVGAVHGGRSCSPAVFSPDRSPAPRTRPVTRPQPRRLFEKPNEPLKLYGTDEDTSRPWTSPVLQEAAEVPFARWPSRRASRATSRATSRGLGGAGAAERRRRSEARAAAWAAAATERTTVTRGKDTC